MYFSPGQRSLGDIVKKVENGERLSREDGLRILNSYDLLAIGYMAKICTERKSGDKILYAYETTNQKEISITMPDSHSKSEFLDYLLGLREKQEQEQTYHTFEIGKTPHSGIEELKFFATARLILDNFDHIKAYTSVLGPKLTQVSLSFGVDSIDGQVYSEKDIVQLIKAAGKQPVKQEVF